MRPAAGIGRFEIYCEDNLSSSIRCFISPKGLRTVFTAADCVAIGRTFWRLAHCRISFGRQPTSLPIAVSLGKPKHRVAIESVYCHWVVGKKSHIGAGWDLKYPPPLTYVTRAACRGNPHPALTQTLLNRTHQPRRKPRCRGPFLRDNNRNRQH